jgi:hypothetical protein
MTIIDQPNACMYIATWKNPSPEPVIDALSVNMFFELKEAMDKKQSGTIMFENAQGVYEWKPGWGTKGVHSCFCDAASSALDYMLPCGLVTNTLALHYLVWHRSEVPESELAKLTQLGHHDLDLAYQDDFFKLAEGDDYFKKRKMSP